MIKTINLIKNKKFMQSHMVVDWVLTGRVNIIDIYRLYSLSVNKYQ